LWNCQVGSSSAHSKDTKMSFTLPNGFYTVTYHYGVRGVAGTQFLKLATNGTIAAGNIDPEAVTGGQYLPYTLNQNVFVTNNKLTFGIWTMNGGGAPVSSLELNRTAGATSLTVSPGFTFNGNVQMQ